MEAVDTVTIIRVPVARTYASYPVILRTYPKLTHPSPLPDYLHKWS